MTAVAPDMSPFDSSTFLAQLTTAPGVYRMYGEADALLYVGKARDLRKRVSSYFLRASGNPRIERMVDQIRRIEVTLTRTEDEALLLEATQIKTLKPRYNVQYRDDKSYPYLRITRHAYPRIQFHRGSTQGGDRYFGPYPSAAAVRETIQTVQKLFQLRPCSDSFMAHRTRPCLQHQIKRCSAPCAGLISEQDYAEDLRAAQRMLAGKGEQLVQELVGAMESAAQQLDFERAAELRDKIAALKRLRQQQSIAGVRNDVDVITVALHASHSCVTVLSVRDGVILGHKSHFPRHEPHTQAAELLESFISQHYLGQPVPGEILISDALDDADAGLLAEALAQRSGHRVQIHLPLRGAKRQLLDMAQLTAQQALSTRLSEAASMDERLLELQAAFDLPDPPQRMECFDISHTRGERPVASCVVFNAEGPQKNAYRRYNIENITPGDDYAAIQQAVARRFATGKTEPASVPDILFIDGGPGQLHSALEALEQCEHVPALVVSIAKGPTRKPGLEQLHLPGRDTPLQLPPDSPALHLIQRIRDEAHRFAITGHRGRRDKARVASDLDVIEGLGPTRRRALLKALGGIAQVRRASVEELARIEGISQTLAQRIYGHLH